MRHFYHSFPDPKFIEPPPNDVLTEMAHKLAEDQLSKLELYPNISSAPDFFIKVPIVYICILEILLFPILGFYFAAPPKKMPKTHPIIEHILIFL